MAVNDKEAIERMAKRLKAQADEVRELEKKYLQTTEMEWTYTRLQRKMIALIKELF